MVKTHIASLICIWKANMQMRDIVFYQSSNNHDELNKQSVKVDPSFAFLSSRIEDVGLDHTPIL